MHGRELLKEGMLNIIGDGRNTRLWLDNWILDSTPRPPRYLPDVMVDLTLTVHDLIDQQTNSWNVGLIRQLIEEEDVERVLKTRFHLARGDSMMWGFTKHGRYDSRSGYKFLENLRNIRLGVQERTPPIEKQLWSKIWKTKTSPKLRHFLWRVLSGALAVKTQLRSRGISVDSTCPVCHEGPETVCHMLFHCQYAKEAWELSQFPAPTAGWSRNSVFLNIHHIVSCSQRSNVGAATRLSFPWLLWHIWKARNKLCFEQEQPVALEIVRKAREETAIWLNLEGGIMDIQKTQQTTTGTTTVWSKPPSSHLKCNIGSSWSSSSPVSGASWIIRDSRGKVRFHSRRAFTGVLSSVHASLLALSWASAAVFDLKLKNVRFEFSSEETAEVLKNPSFMPSTYYLCHEVLQNVFSLASSSIHLVQIPCNQAASAIAESVTRDQRLQSYIATGGPLWLSDVLALEGSEC